MFTAIICGVVSASIALACGLGWLSLAVGALGAMVGCIPALMIGNLVPKERVVVQTLKLKAVHTYDNVTEVYAVRSVTAGGDQTHCVYQMMLGSEDGSVSPYTLHVNPQNTTVYERETESPCLEVSVLKPDTQSALLPFAICDEEKRFLLTLPPGSIRTQFFAR